MQNTPATNSVPKSIPGLSTALICVVFSLGLVFVKPLIAADASSLLRFAKTSNLSLEPELVASVKSLPTNKQKIDELRWQAAPLISDTPSAGLSPSFTAGGVSWEIGPKGTLVRNQRTGQIAFTSALTSTQVRPQTVVDDQSRSAVWFYGDALYKYDTKQSKFYRFSAANLSPNDLRSVAPTPAGLWFAGNARAVRFDDSRETFEAYNLPGTDQLLKAVTLGNAIWFASEKGMLIRTRQEAGIAYFSRVNLDAGIAAEMYAAGDRLWMLLYKDNDYNLASFAPVNAQFLRMGGGVLALRQESGHIIATGYSTQLDIDPISLRVESTALSATPFRDPLIATSKINFLGSTYTVKDPSEVVEHRPVDISRGWQTPQRSKPQVLARRSSDQ